MESIQLPNDVSLTKSLGAIIFLNLVVGGFVAARIVACCGREDRRPFADDGKTLNNTEVSSRYLPIDIW